MTDTVYEENNFEDLSEVGTPGFLPTISMTELAGRLNIGRASLYRVMDRMVDDGIIERSGKTIFVKHPDRLHMA